MTGSLAKMASLERGVTLMDMPEANEYLMDPGYMECVADILDHPVFQSMDQYIQHGTTTGKCHCIQVSYLAYKLYGYLAQELLAFGKLSIELIVQIIPVGNNYNSWLT